MTNSELLDRFKHKHNITTDYALAQFLDVDQQSLSAFRRRETNSLLAKIAAVELASVKLPKSKGVSK